VLYSSLIDLGFNGRESWVFIDGRVGHMFEVGAFGDEFGAARGVEFDVVGVNSDRGRRRSSRARVHEKSTSVLE